MEKVIVVKNEQHTLLPEQLDILGELFPAWEPLLVPAEGWTKDQMNEIMIEMEADTVVFVSPIPYLIRELSMDAAFNLTAKAAWKDGYPHCIGGESPVTRVLVFHNGKREKKELPGGKVVSVTAKTGWELV